MIVLKKFPSREPTKNGQGKGRGYQGIKEKKKKQRKPRGPKWSLWETRCAIRAVIVIRDKFCQDMGNTEMLREFNRLLADLIEECHKSGQCVDHHGFQDRRVSLELCKQYRMSSVDSTTRNTPISRHFEKILCSIRNRLLSLLNRVLDNGRIPTGHQVDKVLEDLSVIYYRELKQNGAQAESGDSGGEGDGVALSSQMEDFHPHEFYILTEWGPTVSRVSVDD